jgi:hypothetical protein
VTLTPEELERVAEVSEAARRTDRYFNEHHDELTQRFPDEWVGLGPDGVIAHSRSRGAVVRALKRRPDIPAIRIKLLSRKKRILIL